MNNLFSDFDAISSKAWKQKIQVDLKGADYNDTLVWQSADDINVSPFYHSDSSINASYQIIPPKRWDICQNIVVSDEKIANQQANQAIKNGAESIKFVIDSENTRVENLIENIDLRSTSIHFETSFLSTQFSEQLSHLENCSNIFHHNDCIGHFAKSGNWFSSLHDDFKTQQAILHNTPHLNSSLCVTINLYQNAGANNIQQLAYGLAHANEYLNSFETKHLKTLVFKVAIGTNYFFEIAKLRALRYLWDALTSEYGITTQCHIFAQPSMRNKTIYDYNTNMLRTTTECMSAILGSANTISNTPYDAVYNHSNEFGERIARNQLLILKKESYFSAVSNATDGSYYIENLTQQIAEKALHIFKHIEAHGGFIKQLKEGVIQRKIKQSAEKEQTLFNEQQLILLGTNKYPNTNDKMKDNLQKEPFIIKSPRKTLIEPIIEKRLAEEHEKKRLKTEL